MAYVRAGILVAVAVLGLRRAALAQAGVAPAAPFSFDAAPGRLPKDVVPTDYTRAISPDPIARTLRGTESIVLDVRKPTARSS